MGHAERFVLFILFFLLKFPILIANINEIIKFPNVFPTERVWMVQTEQQYICIYQCLLAVLEGKENIISPPREIHDNQGYEGIFTFIKLTISHE